MEMLTQIIHGFRINIFISKFNFHRCLSLNKIRILHKLRLSEIRSSPLPEDLASS